jgi:hypothetical protein
MKKSYIYLIERIFKEKRTGKDEERQLDRQTKPCLDLNNWLPCHLSKIMVETSYKDQPERRTDE